ncbi:MAG: adenosylmethionine decarboxylase [Chloroflexota bacterium]
MLGQQLLVDLFECDPGMIDSRDAIESAVHQLAGLIDAYVMDINTTVFSPQGISCVAQISASHIAVHTWPESRFAAVDVFSCQPGIDTGIVVSRIKELFGTTNARLSEISRGEGLVFRVPQGARSE